MFVSLTYVVCFFWLVQLLTVVALAIVVAAAYRSLLFEREPERSGTLQSEASITIDTTQVCMYDCKSRVVS